MTDRQMYNYDSFKNDWTFDKKSFFDTFMLDGANDKSPNIAPMSSFTLHSFYLNYKFFIRFIWNT